VYVGEYATEDFFTLHREDTDSIPTSCNESSFLVACSSKTQSF